MKRAFLAALLMGVAGPCHAATIKVEGNKIFIIGTIDAGDYEVFENKVKRFSGPMMIYLHSKGGMTTPALKIGRFIRQRGWDTHVEFICNSSCALIWLAGESRFRTETAQIGLHAASDARTGTADYAANQTIAEYLVGLGYGVQMLKFSRAAPPDGMAYLSIDDAKRVGIAVTVVPPAIPKQAFGNVNLDRKPTVPKVVTAPPSFKPDPKLVDGMQEVAERMRQRFSTAPETEARPTTPQQPWVLKPTDVQK